MVEFARFVHYNNPDACIHRVAMHCHIKMIIVIFLIKFRQLAYCNHDKGYGDLKER